MIKIGGVALAIGLLAPWLLAMSWRVPFGMFSTKMVLRTAIAPAIGTMLVGLGVEGCLGLATSVEQDGTTGAILGGTIMITIVWLAVRRDRMLRGAVLLSQRLTDPRMRGAAVEALAALLTAARPKNDDRDDWKLYGHLVLVLMTPLTRVGLWERAARFLDAVPAERLEPEQRALRGQALATCRLELDDVPGARKALAAVDRPVGRAEIERWLETTEALLLAIDGDADAALALIGDDEPEEPSLKQSQRLVRAHAYAGRGQHDAALALLEMVRDEVGDDALHRALRPEGPASELARQLRGELEAEAEDAPIAPTLH